MRVFVTSDIHVDYHENRKWLLGLSEQDYRDDMLIVAGDLTDNSVLLGNCLEQLARRFHAVTFVVGNHELWVIRDAIASSWQKLQIVREVARDSGAQLLPFHTANLSVVPLASWYDFSFGEPAEELRQGWSDFRACQWSASQSVAQVNSIFLSENVDALRVKNSVVISFSHFLPRIDLLPAGLPPKHRYLNPVMGSQSLGQQVEQLRPDIHVYGHSHINRDLTRNGIRYVNNAYGYPSESLISRKQLLCIHQT